MKINYNNVFDSIIEAWQSKYDYYKACEWYYKKHGYHAYLDPRRGLNEDERIIMWKSNCNDRADAVVDALIGALFDNDYEQTKRLFSASRALLKWYERTEWQYIPKEELINRLAKFVEG